MLFTRASEYALLAMIYIANKDKPQDVETMSYELQISRSFLAKVLQILAKDGLLQSFKGARGGFCLAKKPEQYTLKEIIDSAEKKAVSVFECSQGVCPSSKKCYILPTLKSLQERLDGHLREISLADMLSNEPCEAVVK